MDDVLEVEVEVEVEVEEVGKVKVKGVAIELSRLGLGWSLSSCALFIVWFYLQFSSIGSIDKCNSESF